MMFVHKTAIFLWVVLANHVFLFAQCNVGTYVVNGNALITGSCKITGDLIINNGATLNIDLSSPQVDTFVVQGNILLQGNAVLWVHGAENEGKEYFIINNQYNNHRSITLKDNSRLQWEHITFRTQEGDLRNAPSRYMSCNVEDKSLFYVNNCKINRETAWLLCNVKNSATFIGLETDGVPTELYLQDAAQISLNGAKTETGVWLNFQGITDTLNLPTDQTRAFTWKIGRGASGLATPWYLEINNAKPGLGVEIPPTAKMTINGAGFPITGELKVAMMFANNTDTIQNLKVGLQNTTIQSGANGGVTLQNVQLGPIAWQLYALMNEQLYIKHSIVNEIAIAGPSQVVVDSSLLQLAVLGAVGIGGSTLIVNDSEIWSQSITASNNSNVILNNCKIVGSLFSTIDAASRIVVNGGCFFPNPMNCTPANMVNIMNGQPNCNPFVPPGFPQALTPESIAFNNVNNCTTATNNVKNKIDWHTFPNPTYDYLYVEKPASVQFYTVELYDFYGTLIMKDENKSRLDLTTFPNGVYYLKITSQDNNWSTKIIKH